MPIFSTVDVYVTPKSKKIFSICLEAGYVVDGLVLLANPSKVDRLAKAYKDFMSTADGVVPVLEKKYNVTPDTQYKPCDIYPPFKIGDRIFSHSKGTQKAVSFDFKSSRIYFTDLRVDVMNMQLNEKEPLCGSRYRLNLQDHALWKLCRSEYDESNKAQDEGDIL